jgi:hypothetical protein
MGGHNGPLKNRRLLIQGGFSKRSNPKENEVGKFKELCALIVTRQGIIQGNVANLSTRDWSQGNSSLLMK